MLKHLVLDEADRLLNMDFEEEIDHILKAIPKVCFLTTCTPHEPHGLDQRICFSLGRPVAQAPYCKSNLTLADHARG